VAVMLTGSDLDGDAITFSVITPPAHGQLAGTGAALSYAPSAGFSGSDTFTYVANDGALQSVPATVTITVAAQNHAPVAPPMNVQTTENHSVNITLAATDPDGDSLTYHVIGQPSAGQLSGTGANLT